MDAIVGEIDGDAAVGLAPAGVDRDQRADAAPRADRARGSRGARAVMRFGDVRLRGFATAGHGATVAEKVALVSARHPAELSKRNVPRTSLFEAGRGDRIRTCDPHTPSVMRYQAALRPDRVAARRTRAASARASIRRGASDGKAALSCRSCAGPLRDRRRATSCARTVTRAFQRREFQACPPI